MLFIYNRKSINFDNIEYYIVELCIINQYSLCGKCIFYFVNVLLYEANTMVQELYVKKLRISFCCLKKSELNFEKF
jgi:hypothetical protein